MQREDLTALEMFIKETLNEDVRKRGNKWCAYVDDKLTKKEKEANPKKYKGKKVGSVQRTKAGKIRMKARACASTKKKANNIMAAAMMESNPIVPAQQAPSKPEDLYSVKGRSSVVTREKRRIATLKDEWRNAWNLRRDDEEKRARKNLAGAIEKFNQKLAGWEIEDGAPEGLYGRESMHFALPGGYRERFW